MLLTAISLAGLSSIVTSCTAFGGVTGRADVVAPNEKGLLETSAAVVPLGAVPNENVAAGAAVEAVEEPKPKPVAGFFSTVEVAPRENGLVAGFSSAGAVLGRCPKENRVAGGGVPKGDLDVSAVGGTTTGEAAEVDVAAGAGGPKAKTLFGPSTLGAAGVDIAAVAGDGAGGGAMNEKGVPFDGAAGFAGGRLGAGAGTDCAGFAGAPNAKGVASDGTVVVGFSASFGTMGGAWKGEEAGAELGVSVANADIGRDCAPNSDAVAPGALGASGISVGFDCSTAEGVKNEDGVEITAGLAKTDELEELEVPEDVDGTPDAGAAVAGTAGASGAILTGSGVGGTSDIVGRVGAGVCGTAIGVAFAVSVAGGAGIDAGSGAGLVRENGSEVIGGSFAWVRSWEIVVYEV